MGLKKILSELRLSYDPNFFAKCHKLDVVSKYYGFVRVISNRSFAKMAIYAKNGPKTPFLVTKFSAIPHF